MQFDIFVKIVPFGMNEFSLMIKCRQKIAANEGMYAGIALQRFIPNLLYIFVTLIPLTNEPQLIYGSFYILYSSVQA